jgi:hypothetical protein
MIVVGFEPTKYKTRDLESLPFDRSGTLPLPYMGLEPTTFRLEVGRAIHCANRVIALLKDFVPEVGFEPTKRDASDLKSLSFDQTRKPWHNYDDKILFLTGLLKVIKLLLQLGSNQRPTG